MGGTWYGSRVDMVTSAAPDNRHGRLSASRSKWFILSAVAAMLLSLGTPAAAQEVGATARADDLPAELEVLWPTDSHGQRQWTLVGRNDQAGKQENLHADLNAVRTIWHLPIARNRCVFKFEFTRPIRKQSNVLHLYVKADGDSDTGRKHQGVHQGVDYMFTLIDGDVHHASTRLDRYEADGRGRRGACTVVLREETLYLAAEMTLRQQDGHSVFEYYVLSYVADGGPSVSLGYSRAESAAAPQTTDPSFLANPKMVVVNGTAPGWQLVRGSRPIEARLTADDTDHAVVLKDLYYPEGLSQTVSLAPGHYLLRALAKTNVFQVHLVAATMQIPVAVSDEHQWVELPFHVPHADAAAGSAVQIGFRYLARPATGNASRLPARLSVREVELIRLGDTVLSDRWAETLPVDPLHRLKLLAESPSWNRPGKVVFQDAFIGTELWLMTQEGKVDHSYVGHPDFSHEGKYLHIGLRRSPRGLLRTDGSMRVFEQCLEGTRLVVSLGTEAPASRCRPGGLDRYVTKSGRNRTAQRGDS